MSIKELVDKILADGKITKEEHIQFQLAITEDGKIDREEKEQINRILDLIEKGEVIVE